MWHITRRLKRWFLDHFAAAHSADSNTTRLKLLQEEFDVLITQYKDDR